MKRAIVLGVLLMVGALSLATRAQQRAGGAPQADAPKVVEVEKLRDNLFMLKGGGGNTAVGGQQEHAHRAAAQTALVALAVNAQQLRRFHLGRPGQLIGVPRLPDGHKIPGNQGEDARIGE